MMQSKNWVSAAFSPLFGTGVGSGMAFLYAIAAAAMTLVGIGGYGFKQLRDVEELLPDHSLIVEDTVR